MEGLPSAVQLPGWSLQPEYRGGIHGEGARSRKGTYVTSEPFDPGVELIGSKDPPQLGS